MKLSTEQFSTTLAALGCAESGTGEHRADVRVPMGTRATIIPCSESGRREPATVVLLNLSETGVGILNNVMMRSGENFILCLPASGKRPAGAVVCTVVYGQSISMGMFAIGAQFTRVLAAQGNSNAAAENQFITAAEEVGPQDLDHVREVEGRLNQLSLH